MFSNYNNGENVILIYLLSVNIISFIMFGIDKWKAKNHKWRISENLLLIISFIGGATGALIGMVIFKHKLSKKKFYIGVPVFIVLNRIGEFLIFNYVK
jgi:uncharacterized membrane protein YsdA (DUF1294 family)